MAFQRKPRVLRPVPKNCPYCKGDTEPYYKDTEALRRYISERGKILSHERTGLCYKHQKRVAQVIKHARHLALIPFTDRV